MDIDRITNPLRLAKGSHQPGSGNGCAMNVISYINGDAQVTDFPACSARPLAALVQSCNDLLAGPGGYLSPDNSVLALELGWQTVGTADVADSVIHGWVAEQLTNPTWGVLRYANISAIKAIIDIAQLHRNVASGHTPPVAAWDAADRAARAAARAISRTSNPAGLYAVRAAYESTAIVDTHQRQPELPMPLRRADTKTFCGSTRSGPLLKAPWAANYQRHDQPAQRRTRNEDVRRPRCCATGLAAWSGRRISVAGRNRR